MGVNSLPRKPMSLSGRSRWLHTRSMRMITRSGLRNIRARRKAAKNKARVSPRLPKTVAPELRAHAFFEGAGGDREAEVVAGVGNAVGAGGIEFAVGAFGFDDQRRGFAIGDFAVALR